MDTFQADDKTFQRLYGQDEQLYDLPAMFVSILNEQERLSQLNKYPSDLLTFLWRTNAHLKFLFNRCPTLTAVTLPFQSTLFGHLYNLMDFVLQHWIPLQVPSEAHQQMQWTTVAKALKAVMKASAVYNSPAAYFVDGILNGLFTYWPFFPYGLSSNKTTNVTESWHVRLSKTIQFFLQSSLYSDYGGQPNPSQGNERITGSLRPLLINETWPE